MGRTNLRGAGTPDFSRTVVGYGFLETGYITPRNFILTDSSAIISKKTTFITELHFFRTIILQNSTVSGNSWELDRYFSRNPGCSFSTVKFKKCGHSPKAEAYCIPFG